MFSANILRTRIVSRTFATSARAGDHGIKTVGVVGAGQMGFGIAYVAAKMANVQVLLADANENQIAKGFALVDSIMKKDISRGKMTQEDADRTRSLLKAVKGIEEFGNVDLAIEAVSESLPLKKKIFSLLATNLPPHAIIASNTSSISISTIAASAIPESSSSLTASLDYSSRVVGFHFMNPVPIMKLVELIPALQTSPEVLEKARLFAVAMGKEVTLSKDVTGFLANRMLMPFINEAIMVLEAGIGTRDDIDTTAMLGFAHPMGPLKLADFIGLDTCASIMETLLKETGDTKYRPSILLGRMVAAGWLGKKSGKGFYDYQ